MTVTPPDAATIVGTLAAGVRTHPNRVLVSDSRVRLTYREFAERVEGVVAALRNAGVRRKDRVALCARNRVESALLIWACARGGFIFMGLPTNLGQQAWQALIDTGTPALVLAEREFLPMFRGAIALDAILGASPLPWSDPAEEPDPDEVYCLVFTSGTTGTPKGVQITHRASMQVAWNYREILHWSPSDVTLIHLPFSYVSGHISQLNPAMLGGSSAVILDDFRPKTVIAAARSHGATVLDLVPWMVAMLLREDDFNPATLPSLRAVIFGGAPMPDATLAALRQRFPTIELFDVYGMSETAGMMTVRHAVAESDAVGRPVPGVRLRVSAEQELEARGALVTPGYWNNPAANLRIFRDGWLRTGDRARIEADGSVRVDGRVSDLINRGGVKIAPEDVEHVLRAHPAIADAAAYGVADGAAGEAVHAAVVPLAGAEVRVAALRMWARERLPVHARPRVIRVVDELPRNPTGKIDRRALRDTHGS